MDVPDKVIRKINAGKESNGGESSEYQSEDR